MKFLKKTIEYSFYLFIFLFPWQTKIVLRAAATNFTEISLYLSHLLLLVILIVFFSYKLRRPGQEEKITWLWGALIGLELMILASFFFAPDQTLAFYHYILFLTGISLFYLLREGQAVAGYEDGLLDQVKIIYSLLASLFLQAVLGIYQFLQQFTPVFKYLGLASHDSSSVGTAVVETASGRWLRAYGGMDHPNIFGGALAISLILAAYLLAKKKVIRSNREIIESLFLFIFYFVALFALFFTFSRAAWLALVLGLLVLLLTLIIKKDYWVLGRFIVLLCFSLVMIFAVAFPYRDLVAVRVSDDTRLEQKSLQERQDYLIQARDLIKNNWLFGVGVGNYTVALAEQESTSRNIWAYQPVHNVFLLLWAQSGTLALIFFCFFLFLLKKDRRTILAWTIFIVLLVLMLADHWLLSLPFGLLFLFLVLGLL
jgi:O-antigen ligase